MFVSSQSSSPENTLELSKVIISKKLEQLGIPYKDINHYLSSFVTPNFFEGCPELKTVYPTNHHERLEFFGDSILSYCISEVIFNKFKDEQEGFLSELRSEITKNITLGKFTFKLGLNECLHVSSAKARKDIDSKIFGDLMESFLGSIYMDLGLRYLKQFIKTHILTPFFSDFQVDTFKTLVKDRNYINTSKGIAKKNKKIKKIIEQQEIENVFPIIEITSEKELSQEYIESKMKKQFIHISKDNKNQILYKQTIKDYLNKNYKQNPEYQILSTKLDEKQGLTVVEVGLFINTKLVATGFGLNRQKAEIEAVKKFFTSIENIKSIIPPNSTEISKDIQDDGKVIKESLKVENNISLFSRLKQILKIS